MQGSSRHSLAAAQERLESLLAVAGTDGVAVGQALFAVVDVIDSTASLRRGLSDPSAESDAKATLVRRLFGGKVSADVVQLVEELARARWSRGRDLTDAAELLAANAVLAGAQSADRADRVEDELFRFERLVDADPQLARTLGDRAAPATSKGALVDDLLKDRAAPETLVLVRRAALGGRGLRLQPALRDYVQLAAARRDQLVAHVRVAAPLDPEPRRRLADALGRLYGKTIHLNVDIDPTVVGGVRVQVGEEVLDGTLSRRLDDVRRRLAG